MKNKEERLEYIDIAKGIAILLVVVGHTVRRGNPVSEDIVRGLIFSFHMPLFFVMSAITTRLSQDPYQLLKRTEKSFIRLIVPAISVYLLLQVIGIIRYGITGSRKAYLANIINTLIYSSGVDIASLNIRALGSLWFLIVLFLSRTIWDYLNLRLSKRNATLAGVVLAIIGYCFAIVQWLPLSFELALIALPFMFIGGYLKRYSKEEPSVYRMISSIIAWLVLFWIVFKSSGHYLEMATREFPLLPLSYTCAVAGVMFVYELSKYISKVRLLSNIFAYLGIISMEIYIIHAMDGLSHSIWGEISTNTYITASVRVVSDVLLALALFNFKSILKRGVKKVDR